MEPRPGPIGQGTREWGWHRRRRRRRRYHHQQQQPSSPERPELGGWLACACVRVDPWCASARPRPSVRPSVQHERFSIARIMTTNRPRPCMPARSLAPRPCGLLVQGEASHKRVPAAPADSIKSLFNSASDKAQALNRNSVFANPSFLFTGCNS